eukprot:364831-Chlamydomonas_euryale.AAC.3
MCTRLQALGEHCAADVLAVADRLPLLAVFIAEPKRGGSGNSGGIATVEGSKTGDIVVGGGGEGDMWELAVEVSRLHRSGAGGGGGRGGGRPRVYAPRFPKLKEEGWYVVMLRALMGLWGCGAVLM